MRSQLSTQRVEPVAFTSAPDILVHDVPESSSSRLGNRSKKRAKGLFALGFFAGIALALSPICLKSQAAYADDMKQSVQEFMQPEKPADGILRDTDYTIDQQPQYAPLDTEDVIDANDAEVTTPIAAFFFWLVMGSIAVAGLAYGLFRTGFARAQ